MRGYDIDKYLDCKFNKLTLIKNLHRIDKFNSKLALFRCECGNVKELVFTQVLKGLTKSCGCQAPISNKKLWDSKEIYVKKLQSLKNKGISSCETKNGTIYRARIMANLKSVHLGYFDTYKEALEVRQKAEEKYFEPIIKKYVEE